MGSNDHSIKTNTNTIQHLEINFFFLCNQEAEGGAVKENEAPEKKEEVISAEVETKTEETVVAAAPPAAAVEATPKAEEPPAPVSPVQEEQSKEVRYPTLFTKLFSCCGGSKDPEQYLRKLKEFL